jgi:hypothetical protein
MFGRKHHRDADRPEAFQAQVRFRAPNPPRSTISQGFFSAPNMRASIRVAF